jgi:uncharacterized cupin superfamily protein
MWTAPAANSKIPEALQSFRNGVDMSKQILNIDDVIIEDRLAMFQPTGATAERFNSRSGQVGARIGAQKLGYNITAVPPGKRAFPIHNHHTNEEMFFILQGSGEVRIGAEKFPIRQGDFIASPPGGPELAHQIINTGTQELRYLAVSTMITPELVEYPDSGKVAGYSRQTAADGSKRVLVQIGRPESGVDYWDGE